MSDIPPTNDYAFSKENLKWFRYLPDDVKEMNKTLKVKRRLLDVAFEYADGAANPPLMTFSEELLVRDKKKDKMKGSRSYAVGSMFALYQYLRTKPGRQRNIYEMIRCGEHWPIKLYMDIEAYPKENPGVDYSPLIDRWIEVCQQGINKYLVDANGNTFPGKCSFTVLNASNEDKISYHVIGHLYMSDGSAASITSPIDCGRFVLFLLYDALKDPELQKLFVGMQYFPNTDTLKEIVHIDTTVFNKNRNFRIEGNSKVGKLRPLLNEERRKLFEKKQYKSALFMPDTDEARKAYFNSFCTYFSPDDRPHALLQRYECHIPTFEEHPDFHRWLLLFQQKYRRVPALLGENTKMLSIPHAPRPTSSARLQPSSDDMLPETVRNMLIDLFAEHHVTKCLFEKLREIVSIYVYSRDCKIAKYEHHSNHIYFLVNIGRDITKRGWWQLCHHCDGQRTELTPLPEQIHPLLDDFWKTHPSQHIAAASFLRHLPPRQK